MVHIKRPGNRFADMKRQNGTGRINLAFLSIGGYTASLLLEMNGMRIMYINRGALNFNIIRTTTGI